MGQKSKTPKGEISITDSDGRIRLRWRYAGERYSLNLPFAYKPENLHLATVKTMKTIILSMIFCASFISLKAQDTSKKEYQIKYEVLTKQGENILVNFLDKDEKNAGATASETWSYSFTTTNKNQNLQIATVGGQTAHRKNGAKVWVKVSIYVNGTLVKSKEEKVLGLGSSLQVNLNEIK